MWRSPNSVLDYFRDQDGLPAWIEHFAAATARAARLAARYLDEVADLNQEWRDALAASSNPPRSDATEWMIIEELTAYPNITAPIAVAATRRSRPQVYAAGEQLVAPGFSFRPAGRGGASPRSGWPARSHGSAGARRLERQRVGPHPAHTSAVTASRHAARRPRAPS
jgi:hypothetical protein